MKYIKNTFIFVWIVLLILGAIININNSFAQSPRPIPRIDAGQDVVEVNCDRCHRCLNRCQILWNVCADPCNEEYGRCDDLCHRQGGDLVDCTRHCSEALVECTSYCNPERTLCRRDCVCEQGCQLPPQ